MPQKYSPEFEKTLEIGRPPNISALFPNSKALIVSGKYIDRAMLKKGNAITMAANGRSIFVIHGALMAAQRANAAIIIEIAKSEGGGNAYCAVNFWNLARCVDAFCNEMGITIPVAIHADHYGLKIEQDVAAAKTEIPSMFDAGITSIAIDASHLPDDKNLLTNIELYPFVPPWAGLETEVGEIKGPVKFAFSMQSNSSGQAQVFWRTPAIKAFGPAHAKRFSVQHDGNWHDYVIDLPLVGSLKNLRFDPSQGSGTIELKDLRLLDASGHSIHTWK